MAERATSKQESPPYNRPSATHGEITKELQLINQQVRLPPGMKNRQEKLFSVKVIEAPRCHTSQFHSGNIRLLPCPATNIQAFDIPSDEQKLLDTLRQIINIWRHSPQSSLKLSSDQHQLTLNIDSIESMQPIELVSFFLNHSQIRYQAASVYDALHIGHSSDLNDYCKVTNSSSLHSRLTNYPVEHQKHILGYCLNEMMPSSSSNQYYLIAHFILCESQGLIVDNGVLKGYPDKRIELIPEHCFCSSPLAKWELLLENFVKLIQVFHLMTNGKCERQNQSDKQQVTQLNAECTYFLQFYFKLTQGVKSKPFKQAGQLVYPNTKLNHLSRFVIEHLMQSALEVYLLFCQWLQQPPVFQCVFNTDESGLTKSFALLNIQPKSEFSLKKTAQVELNKKQLTTFAGNIELVQFIFKQHQDKPIYAFEILALSTILKEHEQHILQGLLIHLVQEPFLFDDAMNSIATHSFEELAKEFSWSKEYFLNLYSAKQHLQALDENGVTREYLKAWLLVTAPELIRDSFSLGLQWLTIMTNPQIMHRALIDLCLPQMNPTPDDTHYEHPKEGAFEITGAGLVAANIFKAMTSEYPQSCHCQHCNSLLFQIDYKNHQNNTVNKNPVFYCAARQITLCCDCVEKMIVKQHPDALRASSMPESPHRH
ncbi:hypothetical protein D5018_05465 [Parashewanella curva]|uniref:Uncharacterized protein n=1 Tax=Parashewanella curva TaxID=2338552 RepID=A0A3L8Q2N9_9GAMM|nr:hypothetical protein [Parashewanella curva]RLV60722.1 hypothetical protein D5018_05465 [Parashewanella curva]